MLTVRKRVLVVCEDSKSSYLYFKKMRGVLRLPTLRIQICGPECGSAPISVVDYAKQKKESLISDEYDFIFCVIDVDTHETLNNAMVKAADNNITIILSNPSFEYWYLLHYEYIGKEFSSSAQVIRHLKRHIKGYNKSSDKTFEIVYPMTNNAIKNSKQILRSQWQHETDPVKCNPSTKVHDVVECLQNIANEAN